VAYSLDEALALLATLEDARDALMDSSHFAEVVGVEHELQLLSRKLGFDDEGGDANG
jgi:hypothetical protein